MRASPFLFDFLYPRGATSLLRRLSSLNLERHDRPKQDRSKSSSPRLYTCSAKLFRSRRNKAGTAGLFPGDGDDASGTAEHETKPAAILSAEAAPIGYQEHDGPGQADLWQELQSSNPEGLSAILSSEVPTATPATYDRVWTLYGSLSSDRQDELRPVVLAFLGTSNGLAEAWRISELFGRLPHGQWNPDVLGAAIKAEVKLQNVDAAVSIFTRGLTTTQCTRGFCTLITQALRSSSDELLQKLCALYVQNGGGEVALDELDEILVLPDLAPKLLKLSGFLEAGRRDEPAADAGPSSFVRNLFQKAVELLETATAVELLRQRGDPLLYETFIGVCVKREHKALAAQVYREYRTLPNVKIRISVLKWMIYDVFSADDIEGMEEVQRDWYRRYPKLDYQAYNKFLSFYAARGDVATVTRLWNEFLTFHPDGPHRSAPLLKAHAVRGELDKMERVFSQMASKYGIEPDRACWNVRLNAHLGQGKYDKGLEIFKHMLESVGPDHYSFGTIIGHVGSRGDLDFALELYRLAKEKKIQMTVAMVDGVVEAYCQNERFSEAQSVCHVTTQARKVVGDYTVLWNTLLHHYANRRDLSSLNRVLALVNKFELGYNNDTYNAMLLGLVNCRQANHAYHLLDVALENSLFRPTVQHYVLLMAAFLRAKRPLHALAVNRLMYRKGFRRTSDQMLLVMKAFFGSWGHGGSALGVSKRVLLGKALQAFHRSLLPDRDWERRYKVAATGAGTAQRYSLMIFLLTQMRDFASIKELVELYRRTEMDTAGTDAVLPTRLLSAMMLSDFYERKFDRVRETWDYIFEATKQAGRPTDIGFLATAAPDGSSMAKPMSTGSGKHANKSKQDNQDSQIVPGMRYALGDPLKTMQRTLAALGDADGLIALMAQVTAAGFTPDRKNWNYHVQILARLKRYREAFVLAEERLMPRWGGWQSTRARSPMKNALPLELRRAGTGRAYVRPVSHTLLVLAKAYLDLEKMAPWSRATERLFGELRRRCGRVVAAVKTQLRTGSRLEEDIFSGEWDDAQRRMPELPAGPDDGPFDPHELNAEGDALARHWQPRAASGDGSETVLATEEKRRAPKVDHGEADIAGQALADWDRVT